MPNWVHNEVYLNGPQDDYIFKCVFNEGKVDFNDIIPMPSDIFSGGPLGEEERKKYGEKNWYDWSCQNWGTKWNACYAEATDDNGVCFDTAWSMPDPIFKEVSRRFPEMTIQVLFADEDRGSNCGLIEYKNGNGQSIDFCDEIGISENLNDYFLATFVWGDDDIVVDGVCSEEDVAYFEEYFGIKLNEAKSKYKQFCEALEKYLHSNKPNKEETTCLK